MFSLQSMNTNTILITKFYEINNNGSQVKHQQTNT